jgi:hypothetical protein
MRGRSTVSSVSFDGGLPQNRLLSGSPSSFRSELHVPPMEHGNALVAAMLRITNAAVTLCHWGTEAAVPDQSGVVGHPRWHAPAAKKQWLIA